MAKFKDFFKRIGRALSRFFRAIGRWLKSHAPTRRRIIQIYSALLFNANIRGYFGSGNNVIYRGATKVLCTPGLNCYSCPGAVTACPLGAFQNAMSASKTRTPYYVIGIIALLGLMLGRTICGFLCPTGLGQDLLHKIRTPKLGKSRYTRVFSYFKYVLLAVLVIAIPLIYNGVPAFCKYVCPAGTFGGALALLINPANADLYEMLGPLFTWKFAVLVVFVVCSIFIYRFFCRFFCPLGAILGFFNKIALIGVKLDKSKCTDCGLCVQTCKMDIKRVGDHECINCGACVSVCPTNAISWKGSKLFLHPSQAEVAPAPEEEKSAPVTDLLKSEPVLAVENAPNNAVVQPVAEIAVSLDNLNENVSTAETNAPEAPEKDKKPKKERAPLTPQERVRKRNLGLMISAWALAVAVLLGTLLYYNVFAPLEPEVAYAAGDVCPEITLTKVFESEGAKKEDGTYLESFDLSNYRGKVVVLNYWYTTCAPCVAELPEFARAKEELGDDVVIAAIHAANMESSPEIQKYINKVDEKKPEDWGTWDLIFALDEREVRVSETQKVYSVYLLGKPTYPMTMILDGDGVIRYTHKGKVSKDDLIKEVKSLQKSPL